MQSALKQILILSGKGGTGKTTVAAGLIETGLIRAFADCDVDAPNLHLALFQNTKPVKTDYFGFDKAMIDNLKCLKCGLCEKNCRFGAIKDYTVDLFECEGCGVCAKLCPANAVKMEKYPSGNLILNKDNGNVFSSASLKIGSGASGKLVSAVKQQLVREAGGYEISVIDGSPGVGCPVIASISGAFLVIIVAEPTVSGIHDMKRIIDTAGIFGVNCSVCINKYDLNLKNTNEIKKHCDDRRISIIGKIPFDKTVIKAANNCRSVVSYKDSPAGKAIISLWDNIYKNYLS